MTAVRGLALVLALVAGLVAETGCGKTDDPCGDIVACPVGSVCYTAATCDAARRCAEGLEGRSYGRATAEGGRCLATDDAHCARAEVSCGLWGQCSAPTGPPTDRIHRACVAKDGVDTDHLASRDPRCAKQGFTCVANSDADCEAARICAVQGRCHAQDGICVADSPAECAASTLCEEIGRCTLTRAGTCRPGSVADCERSAACEGRSYCGLSKRGACVSCRSNLGCATEGLCDLVDGSCRATNNAHCAASQGCRKDGRCVALRGRCIRG